MLSQIGEHWQPGFDAPEAPATGSTVRWRTFLWAGPSGGFSYNSGSSIWSRADFFNYFERLVRCPLWVRSVSLARDDCRSLSGRSGQVRTSALIISVENDPKPPSASGANHTPPFDTPLESVVPFEIESFYWNQLSATLVIKARLRAAVEITAACGQWRFR